MTVGVLAFHGDFAEHIEVLRSLGVKAIEVRSLEDLKNVQKLIIPGGESTVVAKFLEESGVGKQLQKRVRMRTLSIYGTCAGAILLAKKVVGKHVPKTLRLMNISVERNAYGTQLQSFQTKLSVKGVTGKIDVAFIRAPIITRVGRGVEVLASYQGHPVLVRKGNILAGTFHPELRGSKELHRLFLAL